MHESKGIGPSGPVPLIILRAFLLLFLCFGPATVVQVHSQTPLSSALSPGIDDIIGEDLEHRDHRANERKLWGTFTVTNPGLTPFILRVTFTNRAALVNDENVAARIALRNLELRYRNPSGVTIQKSFSGGALGTNGFVYELHFLQEDVQDIYKMELWSALRELDARHPQFGVYRELIRFEIEVRP